MSRPLAPCHLCREPGLEELSDTDVPTWITSDFRPWPAPETQLLLCPACGAVQKSTSQAWHQAIEAIYASYDPYPQGRRIEQASFVHAAGSAPLVRSEAILRQVIATLDLPGQGRMLDVGCGDGSLIASFGRLRPHWRLNAADVSSRFRDRILTLPGVEGFHSIDPACIEGPFDLVTMVHVFEHIVDPIAVLSTWRHLIGPGGKLLIQVPNLAQNPFDLVILDHATHFTLDVLTRTIRRAGFDIMVAVDDWVAKELTVIATPGLGSDEGRSNVGSVRTLTLGHLSWLGGLAGAARAASEHRPFGIFGTSIAASWLHGSIDGKADFFVDEDPNRIGGLHFSRPILSPAAVDPAALLFVPLPPVIAGRVGERLRALGLRIALPPVLADDPSVSPQNT